MNSLFISHDRKSVGFLTALVLPSVYSHIIMSGPSNRTWHSHLGTLKICFCFLLRPISTVGGLCQWVTHTYTHICEMGYSKGWLTWKRTSFWMLTLGRQETDKRCWLFYCPSSVMKFQKDWSISIIVPEATTFFCFLFVLWFDFYDIVFWFRRLDNF